MVLTPVMVMMNLMIMKWLNKRVNITLNVEKIYK